MDGWAVLLPRVMVYHVERTTTGDILDQTFQVIEFKLLKVIMNPAMIVTWVLESFWQSRLGSWIGQKHGCGLKRAFCHRYDLVSHLVGKTATNF